MRRSISRSVFVVLMISALVLTPLPQFRADEFDDVDQAAKDFDQATKDAEGSMPSPDVRNAENKLDQAEQKLDDLNADPNAAKDDKKQAESDRDQAKADADQARKDTDPDGDFTKQYDKYRDALKRRRSACKTLKKLIPPMEKEIKAEATGKQGIKSLREEDDKAAHKSKLQKARDRVKKCGQPPTFAIAMPGVPLGGPSLAMLVAAREVAVDITGTGEVIGHIADFIIENVTDQPIECSIPPMILESGSGKNQHYACPKREDVALKPHEKKKVPIDGVCLNRNKPPVGKGVGGDLLMNDGSEKVPSDRHLKPRDADKLLRLCTAKYDAVDKLQKEGKLDDLPYKDKKKQRDICVQWSTWTDPRICEVTDAPPATKDDLKRVVYKQVQEQGPLTEDKKKKIDEGIDKIFEKIELTTEKAKDLEKPETEGETTPAMPPGTVEVTNDTPAPQTEEKPKKEKKKKKWPKPIQDWLDKHYAADKAHREWGKKKMTYLNKLWDYIKKNSPHTQELRDKAEAARKKANEPGSSQADRDAADTAEKEVKKQMDELEKDYQKTPEGKGEFDKVHEAEKVKGSADDAEKEAEKKLPPGIDKEGVLEEDALKNGVPARW